MGRSKVLHSSRGADCPPVRMARPAVLDSFSHFPHISTRLVHILSRVVGRCAELISSGNCEHSPPRGFVSIASTRIRCWGGSAASENRVYLIDWVQSRPQGFNCASAYSSENAYHKPWFSFFVRRTEHFRLPLRGVNHAEWSNDEHENTPTETGSVICCPLKAVVIERQPPRTRLSQRAKKLSAISGARPC